MALAHLQNTASPPENSTNKRGGITISPQEEIITVMTAGWS